MSNLEAALKSALSQVDESFRRAENDLLECVKEAFQAVSNVTIGFARLEIPKVEEDLECVYYELRLVDKVEKEFHTIASFGIQLTGYPIVVGKSVFSLQRRSYELRFTDKEDLKKYFEELFSKADSPLVLRLSLLIRKNK